MNSSYGCNVANTPVYSAQASQLVSPYADFATRAVPNTFSDVIDWSEMVSTMSGDLAVGMRRLYTYFCTPLNIEAQSGKQEEAEQRNTINWTTALQQEIGYLEHCTQTGINTGVYGNDFVTVMLKHKRFVKCPRCSWQVLVREAKQYPAIELDFSDMVFSGFCQSKACRGNSRVRFELEHVYDRQISNLWIKHWPIRELEFDYMDFTDSLQIYWRVPNRIKNKILRDKDPEVLHDADIAVLRCVCEGKLLAFDDRVMFHAKEPHLSGLENRGLGIPRTLALARQDWLVQLLKKHCQAISKDYVVPMEFFSMGGGSGSGLGAMDPVQSVDARLFASYVDRMIRNHKYNPGDKYVIPFPVTHQLAGASANQFVPTELMALASRDLSNSLVPQAMLNGDLNAQAAPMFLRMFEAFNREIPSLYNRFLRFLVSRVSELLRTSPVTCSHQSASVADNVQVDGILLNAAMMGKCSDYAWMSRLQMSPEIESARMLAESRKALERQKDMAKIQEEIGFTQAINAQAGQPLVAAAQGQPQGQPGQPGQPGQVDPATGQPMGAMPGGMLLPSQGFQPSQDIMQMEGEAQQMAQMLGGMPNAQRTQELAILRKGHTAFHSLVTAALEQLRNSTAMQARQQVAPTL